MLDTVRRLAVFSRSRMASTQQQGIRYDVARMQEDMALRGWMAIHLARVAGLSPPTVGMFLRGERQTAKTAHKLALALGYTVKRYLISSRREVA